MSIRMMGQASTTMNQLQKKLDVIGHNLANLNTYGYKARRTEFQSLLHQHMINLSDQANSVGRITPNGIRVGTGAKLGAINNNLTIGTMMTTERALDTMLLNVNHFYQIYVNKNGVDEIRYTRDGAFYLTPVAEGVVALVTSDGYPVYGENGPIQFRDDFDEININERGEIHITVGTEDFNVDTLQIVEVVRPRLLEATGEKHFRLPNNLEQLGFNEVDIIRVPNLALNSRLVQSNVLEMSNVALEDEMTEMIIAQRAYQLNARSITTADQMQGLVNQLR